MKELIEDFICLYDESVKEGKEDREELYRFILLVQHERLVHLIISIVTALIWLILLGLYIIFPLVFTVPAIVFTVVLLCYIHYYCMLENTVQLMYKMYEGMIDLK